MSVALIACSNGFGHTRRLLSIYYQLKKKNIKAKLFAKKKTIIDLVYIYKLEMPNFVNFDSKTDIKYLIDGSAYNWEKKLPSLKKYKIILSDNLPDILKLRKDSLLSGSFLWHLSLNKINSNIKKNHEQLISRYKPTMISSELFTPKYINVKTKLNKVGLYTFEEKEKYKKNNKKKDLLISFGSNDNNKIYMKILKIILNDKKTLNQFKNIWVEPSLIDSTISANILRATYTKKMYSNLKLAIIRPGIGTLTELIKHRVGIIHFHETKNLEMKFNSRILNKYNLGVSFKNITVLPSLIKSFKLSSNSHYNNINFNGASETAKIIEKKLLSLKNIYENKNNIK